MRALTSQHSLNAEQKQYRTLMLPVKCCTKASQSAELAALRV
jgi:hypothetical protein